MAIVDMYVVEILKTHGKYGTGDFVALRPSEYEAYQKDGPANVGPKDPKAWRNLIRLHHIDKPNGDRHHADDDGVVTEDARVTKGDRVRAENELKSTIHYLARAEKLTIEEEQKLVEKVLADKEVDVAAFLKPGGAEAYFQGRAAAEPPKKPAGANRLGQGPGNRR